MEVVRTDLDVVLCGDGHGWPLLDPEMFSPTQPHLGPPQVTSPTSGQLLQAPEAFSCSPSHH